MTKDFLEFTRLVRKDFIRRDPRITARTCFSVDELRSFTIACSEKGEGRVWRCRYCQELLTLHMLRFDHRLALKQGGPTTIENLAICCHRCNTMKGQLDEHSFKSLRAFLAGLPSEHRMDIEGRLCAGPRWRGRFSAKKQDPAAAILDHARSRGYKGG